jgi:hypothetical protein
LFSEARLKECDIPYRQSLQNSITRIFDEIEQETITPVFETDVDRFGWVMEQKEGIFSTVTKMKENALIFSLNTREDKLFDPSM